MSTRPDDIVIVGAGPTGLTAACLLLRHGVRCRIVDAAPATTERSRAIGVSARSLEVLAEIGVADELVERGLPSRVANFYARGQPIARLTSQRTRHTRFPFLLAVPQSVTERVLEARLEALGGAVDRGIEVTAVEPRGERVELVASSSRGLDRSSASWVVAADGSHSVVRKSLGIEFEGAATGSVFANVDTILDPGPTPGEGHYHFSPEGLLVVAPLPGGVYRVTASISDTGAGEQLTPERIEELLARRAGSRARVTELADAGWGVATFAVQARIASRFSHARCLLAGDCAHVFGPTGAQGMNTGIQDAHNLAWKLALVTSGAAGEDLLASYDAERRPVAHRVLEAVEEQTRMAMVRSPLARAARDAGLRLASRTGLLDRKLAPRVNQLDVDYAGTPGIAKLARRSPAGRRIPDAPVEGGGRTTLFKVLRAAPFNVLVLDATRAERDAVRGRVDTAVPRRLEVAVHMLTTSRATRSQSDERDFAHSNGHAEWAVDPGERGGDTEWRPQPGALGGSSAPDAPSRGRSAREPSRRSEPGNGHAASDKHADRGSDEGNGEAAGAWWREGSGARAGATLVDVDGALDDFLRGSGARVALIRPDLHVAASAPLDELDAVLDHFRRAVLHADVASPRPVRAKASASGPQRSS